MIQRYASALCLGALYLASSCGSNGPVNPLALYPASPEGHAARLRGTLEMDGGCLYITGEEGGERWLAVFPSPGTSWNPEDRSVQVRGTTLQVGATGSFDGGESNRGAAGIPWVQAPKAGCDDSKIWWVTHINR